MCVYTDVFAMKVMAMVQSSLFHEDTHTHTHTHIHTYIHTPTHIHARTDRQGTSGCAAEVKGSTSPVRKSPAICAWSATENERERESVCV
jgi:hypothetical protein